LSSVDFDKLNLGSTSRLVILDSIEDHCNATLSLIAQARTRIQILSSHLEPEIYSEPSVVAAFSRFIRRAPLGSVEILLVDSQNAQNSPHKLIELARSNPEFIVFKQIVDEFLGTTETFLIADEVGLIWRQQKSEYNAVANFCAARDAKAKSDLHQRIWDISDDNSAFS